MIVVIYLLQSHLSVVSRFFENFVREHIYATYTKIKFNFIQISICIWPYSRYNRY